MKHTLISRIHIRKTLMLFLIAFLFQMLLPAVTYAQCAYQGQCINNRTCVYVGGGGQLSPIGAECGSAAIGGVTAPQGVYQYNLLAGTYGTTTASGLVIFVSRVMQLASVIAGIFMMVNLMKAGYIYITKFGEVSAHGQVKDLLTYSVIGLVLMVSAFAAGGLIGLIFFGDAGFVLQPELEGAIPPS